MKKKIILPLVMLMILSLSHGKVYAEISDGTYSIDYQVLHADNDSASIANDYFEKPAILFVENGEKHIQFTLNHSQWTKVLQAPLEGSFLDVDVVSENHDEDTRIVQFKVEEDLAQPLEFKMHVLIETMEPVYDHRYTVRFDFDTDSMEKVDSAEFQKIEADNREAELAIDKSNEKQVDNPLKGERSPIVLFITLIVLILAILLSWKIIRSNKK